ncbi:Transporter of the ATP-binding cassette (ABC), partial [Coemansia sp. RSA 2559]
MQGIKVVKLFGWESRFIEKVDEKREEQLGYAWKVFLWASGVNASAALNPILILAITFTTYVAVFGNTLNAEIAFTSIAIFQMVRAAISHFPKIVNFGIGGYVALKRIDSYLKQSHIQDLEERTPAQTSSDELGFDCADLEWNSADSAKVIPSTAASDSTAPTKTNTNVEGQSTENTPLLAETSQTQTALSVRSSAIQISDQDGVARFSLKDIDVKFPLGGLSIIAGPTGS